MSTFAVYSWPCYLTFLDLDCSAPRIQNSISHSTKVAPETVMSPFSAGLKRNKSGLERLTEFGGWPHTFLCPGFGGRNSSEASLTSLTLPRGRSTSWVTQIRMISCCCGGWGWGRRKEPRRKSGEYEDLAPIQLPVH